VWIPYTATVGSIITNWQDYVPTILGFTTISNNNFRWRRVGSSLEVEGYFTGASPSGSDFRIPFPNGLTVNTNQTIMYCGTMATNVTSSNFFKSFSLVTQNGLNYVNYSIIENYPGSATALFMGNDGSDYLTGTHNYSVKLSVPINGWGSNVFLTSTVGDGRQVAAQYRQTDGSTFSISIPGRWFTRVYDTHGAVSIGTRNSSSDVWKFTAPCSGYYFVHGTTTCNASSNMYLIKNGVQGVSVGYCGSFGNFDDFHGIAYLNAGEYISIGSTGAGAVMGTTNDAYISVFKLPDGNQAITNGETIACSYYISANTTTSAQINFNTKIYDDHNAVTTGASWKFTAPVAGKYLITGHIGGNENQFVTLYKNNSMEIKTLAYIPVGGNTSFSNIQNLLAGDYIDLRPASSSILFYGGALTSGNNICQIQITRMGM
jgi:hypothetical protein